MSSWECDKIKLDTQNAQDWVNRKFKTTLRLDPDATQRLVDSAENINRFVDKHVIAQTLREYGIDDPNEHEAYRRALTKVFGRRIGYRMAQRKKLRGHVDLDIPVHYYEQNR